MCAVHMHVIRIGSGCLHEYPLRIYSFKHNSYLLIRFDLLKNYDHVGYLCIITIQTYNLCIKCLLE